MIKKSLSYIILLCCLLQMHTHTIILESNKLEDVYKHLKKNTLVLFDIDNTIANIQGNIEPWVHHKAEQLSRNGLNKEEAFHFTLCMFFILTDFAKFLPIGNAPDIIQDLQKKSIPVLALTKRSMPFSKMTIKKLRKIGIDFSKQTLYQKNINLPATYMGGFSHGIIFTGSNKKGEILSLFLKKTNLVPSKIIFLDDRRKHLQSVANMCKEKNIPFVGIRISLMDSMKKNFNLTKAEKEMYKLKVKAGFKPLKPPSLTQQTSKKIKRQKNGKKRCRCTIKKNRKRTSRKISRCHTVQPIRMVDAASCNK